MKRIDLVITVPNEVEAEVSATIVDLIKTKEGEIKAHHVVTLKEEDKKGSGAMFKNEK